MSIKRNTVMNRASRSVKKFAAPLLPAIVLCAVAPNAFASPIGHMVDKTVSVSFSLSELDAADGTSAVYAKLEKRAASFCKADKLSLRFLDQTVEDCVADLVNQFVDSADISELSAYHETHAKAKPVEKLVMADVASQ